MADFARGQRLQELRDRKHQSQENAAHEIGVSAKSLREWEHGGKIRWENAKKVAAYYGVDPELLVSRETPEPEEEPQVPPSQLDRIEARLDEIYALLTGGPADQGDPGLAGLADRVLSAGESPPRKAGGRSATRPGARRRNVA